VTILSCMHVYIIIGGRGRAGAGRRGKDGGHVYYTYTHAYICILSICYI